MVVVVDVVVDVVFIEVTRTTAGIVGGAGAWMVVPPGRRKTRKILHLESPQVTTMQVIHISFPV